MATSSKPLSGILYAKEPDPLGAKGPASGLGGLYGQVSLYVVYVRNGYMYVYVGYCTNSITQNIFHLWKNIVDLLFEISI